MILPIMKIGAYYYPDQWPEAQWERDFDNVVKMGLQIVHIGEFAWGTIEPSEGKYDFHFIEKSLELAKARKLDVILCTPTAVLPVWMIDKHPDILFTGLRFGGRRHGNHFHPALRDYTAKVVKELAERFGDHPSVIGWQLDNEYNSPDHDQSDVTRKAFQEWLKRKYKTIEALNKAWGCVFWNTFYTSFDQIKLPKSRNTDYRNPHENLDAARFWSWGFADYNKISADILRPMIGKRWITTNFMPMFSQLDPGDMRNEFDLYAWDSYPVTGWEKNAKDENFRIADPNQIGMMHDQMASYTGRWSLMEMQPGQTNWSGYPILLHPGSVRLWLWTAFAHGAEFVTTYRFRQPLWGIELFHHGLVNTDGQTPSPGGREFMQVIGELSRIKSKEGAKKSDIPTIGLMLDFDQMWYYEVLPQAKRWNYGTFLRRWYNAIMRMGCNVKIILPHQEIPKDLPMVIAPGVQMMEPGEVANLKKYVDGGGHLVLTCRSGLMNRTGQLHEASWAAPILPLIGAKIEAYDALPEETFGKLDMDAKKYEWGVWGDLIYAEPGTRVLAKYDSMFYAGTIAVTQKAHAKGVVTYCGVFAEQPFVDALVEKLTTDAKLKTTLLPDRCQLLSRNGMKIFLNYQDKPVTAPAPSTVKKFIIGQRRVEPAGVAVWEE